MNTVPIYIVFAADDNYVNHLSVALMSLFKHADPHREIVTRIMIITLTKENKEALQVIASKYGRALLFITLDPSVFRGVYLAGHVISPLTYARVIIPEIFDVEKMLYLDCDLLIKCDISQLWDIDISDEHLIAAREPMMERSRNKALGMLETDPYFNSGVLLINCPKWRKDEISRKVLEFAKNEHEKMKYCDQDALNVVLKDKWKLLHPKWNQLAHIHYYASFAQTDYSEKDFNECKNNPCIVHFTYKIKPNSFKSTHPERMEYAKYLLQTPWAETFQDKKPEMPQISCIIDPDFTSDSGHHPKLNDAIYTYSVENNIKTVFFTRDNAKTSQYKIFPVFKRSGYVWNTDWLTWISGTLNRANMFRSALKMYIEPLTNNESIHLLLHSATLPMVIGLAEWLLTLPVESAPKKIGLHFHAEPYFGNIRLESTQKIAAEALNKIYEYMKKTKGTFLLSTQHPSSTNEWKQHFLGEIHDYPTPTLFKKVSRQRRSSRIRLLFIGNLRSEKNIGFLLQSAKPLLHNLQNLEIKIVTSSSTAHIDINENMLPKERFEIIHSHYIDDSLYYQEIVDADIVWCIYSKNTYSNRASNVFWEAQAHGVPCLISTQTGAYEDYVKNQHESAIPIDEYTVQSLYDACRKALAHIDYYKEEAHKVKQYYLDRLAAKEWYALHFK